MKKLAIALTALLLTFSSGAHAQGRASQDGMSGSSDAARITVGVLSGAALITVVGIVAASASSSVSSHA